ncbi:hypothetical protein NA66_104815 [Burkholderia pyrrocinia]|uniref:Uncharacterized protein n=1 Tax=Burkholderia pyrrocinia TaxID=60550 RepID=A0A318HTK0_BURPY|nr:hypothetical protein NA66_104815 [Burkholderia pyrrocinia]SFW90351.1 hypothetical protein SAMN03159384_06992 [Burkholderia sp. NFACC33-1]SFY46451.1 hypothetical protein SAMN03159408_06988 [Burkholderia sp. NFPP32]
MPKTQYRRGNHVDRPESESDTQFAHFSGGNLTPALEKGIVLLHELPRFDREDSAKLGQLSAPPPSGKQQPSDFLFEPVDLPTERWLGEIQDNRRPAEIRSRRKHEKGTKQRDFHAHNVSQHPKNVIGHMIINEV